MILILPAEGGAFLEPMSRSKAGASKHCTQQDVHIPSTRHHTAGSSAAPRACCAWHSNIAHTVAGRRQRHRSRLAYSVSGRRHPAPPALAHPNASAHCGGEACRRATSRHHDPAWVSCAVIPSAYRGQAMRAIHVRSLWAGAPRGNVDVAGQCVQLHPDGRHAAAEHHARSPRFLWHAPHMEPGPLRLCTRHLQCAALRPGHPLAAPLSNRQCRFAGGPGCWVVQRTDQAHAAA